MVRIIPEEEIEEHLSLNESIDALEKLHNELAEGRATTGFMESKAGRVPNPPEEATGSPTLYDMRTMDGIIEEFGVSSVRINSDIVHWPKKEEASVRDKLPVTEGGYYNGLVMLLSLDTGEPLAMIPDAIIQHFRVGGSSALGAKYLANEDATKLGMLGAGWQARSHLPALDYVLDFDTVEVYSPTPESRKQFADEMDGQVNPKVEAVEDPEMVFQNADVVQCATNAVEGAVFEAEWVEPGTHIGIIRTIEAPDSFFDSEILDVYGTNFPDVTQHEFYGRDYRKKKKKLWTWNQYVTEAGKQLPRLQAREKMTTKQSLEDKAVPLADLVSSQVEGRTDSDDVTAFVTAGLGVDFTAVSKVLYDEAEEKDLGKTISTELISQTNHP